MVQLYDKDYVLKTKRQRDLLLALFIGVITAFVVGIVAIILIYANEPFNTDKKPLLMGLMLTFAVLCVCFTFLFYMLVYSRVNKYYLFMITTVFCPYKEFKTTVINVLFEPQDYNGIDFYRLLVLEWSEHQNDFVERTILVDAEKSLSGVKKGDIITVRVNANTLLAYKVGE